MAFIRNLESEPRTQRGKTPTERRKICPTTHSALRCLLLRNINCITTFTARCYFLSHHWSKGHRTTTESLQKGCDFGSYFGRRLPEELFSERNYSELAFNFPR
ncbi:uncharacterized protein LOC121467560 [Drosophila elegans]|uniref:uncharacterized protein LOC121467560 n=1 Tax=Drosophila elegans TaxID=30023 RepID=UPI001BC85D0C|nr:uncharacterized protein LOC121467560 [Drosophila elegans]